MEHVPTDELSPSSNSEDEDQSLRGVPTTRLRHRHRGHVHRPFDKRKALDIGSLNFAPVYNEMHNQHRAKKRIGFAITSAALPILMGVLIAFAAYFVGIGSEWLGEARVDWTLSFIRSGEWKNAWLANTGVMLTLAYVGAMPVIIHFRAAGSSGIPAVIGLLNGCDLREHFTVKTFLVKLVGVTCAVASGLIAGPEGPMIYVGACVGAIMSKIPSHPKMWRYLGTPPGALNKDVFLRDYVAIGAGCGVAAAFRAPIAGTLFVVEEAASHFKRAHLVKIFMAGLAATEVIVLLTDGRGILPYQVTTGPECGNWGPSFFFFVILGVVCGLAGALFNWINVGATKFRARYIKGSQPFRRFLDIAILSIVTSSISVFLPSYFPESEAHAWNIFKQSTGCITDTLKDQLISGSNIFYIEPMTVQDTEAPARRPERSQPRVLGTFGLLQSAARRLQRARYVHHLPELREAGTALKYAPRPCLYGVQHNGVLCPQAYELANSSVEGSDYAKTCTWDLMQSTKIMDRPDFRFFCCAFDVIEDLALGRFQVPANATCHLQLGETMPSLKSEFSDRNQRHQREDAGELPSDLRYDQATGNQPKTYNAMASLTLVPMAEVAANLFARGVPYVLPLNTLVTYIPVFYLLAALTAGSAIPSGLLLPQMVCGALIGRTLTLAVIRFQLRFGLYQEVNADTSIWSPFFQPFFAYEGGPLPEDAVLTTAGFLDPGVGALVGAAAFLGGSGRITLFTTVMMVEITGDPLMILPVGLATIVAVVVGNSFGSGLYHALIDVQSFPYLPDVWPTDHLPRSLRVKDALALEITVIVVPLNGTREDVEAALTGNEYNGFPVVDENGVAVGFAERAQLEAMLERIGELDVGRVTDFHTLTVRPELPLEVAYQLFKRLEMRHLVVVDDGHHPQAVLTRESLLPWVVEERIGKFNVAPDNEIRRPDEFRHERTTKHKPQTVGRSISDLFNLSRPSSPQDSRNPVTGLFNSPKGSPKLGPSGI